MSYFLAPLIFRCHHGVDRQCVDSVSSLHGFRWSGTHPRFWTCLCQSLVARCETGIASNDARSVESSSGEVDSPETC